MERRVITICRFHSQDRNCQIHWLVPLPIEGSNFHCGDNLVIGVRYTADWIGVSPFYEPFDRYITIDPAVNDAGVSLTCKLLDFLRQIP